MKKVIFITMLILLTFSFSSFAQTTASGKIKLPEIKDDQGELVFEFPEYELDEKDFEEILKEFNFETIASSFGDAAVFANNSVSLKPFQGYNLFALNAGATVSARVPSYDVEQIENELNGFSDGGDVSLGLAVAAPVFNIGVNTGTLLTPFGLGKIFKNLYVNFKIGGGSYFLPASEEEDEKSGLEVSSFAVGLGVNYLVTPKINLGLIKFGGLNLGTGFYMQNTGLNLTVEDDDGNFDDLIDSEDESVTVSIKTQGTVGINSSVFIVPLEASTFIQLGILNLSFAAGADLGFGTSEASIKFQGDIKIEAPYTYENLSGEDGYFEAKIASLGKPNLFNPRFSMGLGTKIGPVILDIPFDFYFNKGIVIGLNFGVAL